MITIHITKNGTAITPFNAENFSNHLILYKAPDYYISTYLGILVVQREILNGHIPYGDVVIEEDGVIHRFNQYAVLITKPKLYDFELNITTEIAKIRCNLYKNKG